MAKKSQRAFALFAATLFLISSVGLSVFVIWEMYQQSKQTPEKTAQEQLQNQLKDQQNSSKGKPLDNYQPVTAVPELQKIDVKVGEGKEVQPGDAVKVHYTGALAKDGKIFETSKDTGEPVTFALDQVIPGWTQGLPGMKVGGTRRLLIPASMAYGEQGSGETIPPNSDLVFDIVLLDISPKQQ